MITTSADRNARFGAGPESGGAHDVLDETLLQLSPLDVLSARAAAEGILIVGATGAGKTTTSGKRLALAFLEAGHGGLVLCVKPDEARRWIEYARTTGRGQDLIIFNRESGLRFDGIAYEWAREGRASNDLESLLDLLNTMMTIGQPEAGGGRQNEQFWESKREELMRVVIMLLAYAGERVSIASMDRVISSLPSSIKDSVSQKWQDGSFCWRLFGQVKERHPELFEETEEWKPGDMDTVADYVLNHWPRLDPRTRSNVHGDWSGCASRFLFQPFSDIFCSGVCDFTLEQTFTEGKIIVVDWPILHFNQSGRIIAGLLKLVFYRVMLRRNVREHPLPVFAWHDESSLLMLPGNRENQFAQVARESRVENVWLTQSVSNIAEQLGEHYAGAKTKALLGNLSTKIFHQQTDVDTNKYAADLIGQEYRYLKSVGSSMSDPSVGQSEHLEYRVLPSDFSALRKPDGQRMTAEAIVVQGGKTFESTKIESNPRGRNYLRVLFSR